MRFSISFGSTSMKISVTDVIPKCCEIYFGPERSAGGTSLRKRWLIRLYPGQQTPEIG